MKRIGRSRKGFTLVEIVLVVAIIVILAGVSFVGIKAMLNNANKNADSVALHAGCWYKPLDNQDLSDEEKQRYNFLNGKWVEVVPKGTPGAQYYSDMDDMYNQVNNIVPPVPNIPAEQYNPGGGGLNPGTGGSGGNPVDPGTGGGDNPGDNPGGGNPGGGNNPGDNPGGDNPGGGGAQNPVTPDDPMWNGHPESWWDEHDAEIEKKIQEAIGKGVNPDDIKVTRDPETGHITNYVIPAAPNSGSGNGNGNGSGNGSNNGNVTVSGHAVQAHRGNVGTISSSTSGNTTTLHITDTNGYNDLTIKIINNGDGTYTTELGGAQYNLNNNGKIPKFPGYVDNQGTYTLNDAQKKWFTDNYGVNFG